MSDAFIVQLPPEFPLDDVLEIEKTLSESGALIPGYIPPAVGALALPAIFFAEHEGWSITILPDRNITSRMARIARDGVRVPFDYPTRIAVRTMAFAQAMNIVIEPSIAFHELAHCEGNNIAHEELRWFRAADHGQARDWIDIALGRRERLGTIEPGQLLTDDLAFPLHRWRSNYLVALKVAELELTKMRYVERALRLFDWMVNDFLLAGPAAIFATMYFSPRSARRRLIKHIRSPERERAIKGIKNAAWDMTHLSMFAERAGSSEAERRRYLFATADRNLASIAPVLMVDPGESTLGNKLSSLLEEWWDPQDANAIALSLAEQIAFVANRPPSRSDLKSDLIPGWTAEAEQKILHWSQE